MSISNSHTPTLGTTLLIPNSLSHSPISRRTSPGKYTPSLPSPDRCQSLSPSHNITTSNNTSNPHPPKASPQGQASRSLKPTSSHPRPTPDDPPEQPPSKRMRPDSQKEKRTARPCSTTPSSSQGGMAESELDTDCPRQKQEDTSSPASTLAAPPPKKKRTRTLTTPHQSAVLHALLAQSRFPTTAMRDEVGRSIGLSARKVQIWFQNQRQKARRPNSQSGAPQSRPHHGSILTPQLSSSVLGEPSAHTSPPGSTSQCSRHSKHSSFDDRTPVYQYADNGPPQLLGPGMPGQPGESSRGRDHNSLPSSLGRLCVHESVEDRRRYSSPVMSSPHVAPRPATAQPSKKKREYSPTLPPLLFDLPPRRGSFSAPGPGRICKPPRRRRALPRQAAGQSSSSSSASSRSTRSPIDLAMPSPGSESPFAHQLPPEQNHRQQQQQQRSSPSSLHLAHPPPTTLQPQPHWDTSMSPFSTWSRHRPPQRTTSRSYGESSYFPRAPGANERRWDRGAAEREQHPRGFSPASWNGDLSSRETMVKPFSSVPSRLSCPPPPPPPEPRSQPSSPSPFPSSPPPLSTRSTGRYDPVRATFVSYESSSKRSEA